VIRQPTSGDDHTLQAQINSCDIARVERLKMMLGYYMRDCRDQRGCSTWRMNMDARPRDLKSSCLVRDSMLDLSRRGDRGMKCIRTTQYLHSAMITLTYNKSVVFPGSRTSAFVCVLLNMPDASDAAVAQSFLQKNHFLVSTDHRACHHTFIQ